jgi:hypothetical protein
MQVNPPSLLASYTWDSFVNFDLASGLDLASSGDLSIAPMPECRDFSCLRMRSGATLTLPTYNFGKHTALSFSIWFKVVSDTGPWTRLLEFSTGVESNIFWAGRYATSQDMSIAVARPVNAETYYSTDIMIPNGWKLGTWTHLAWVLTPTSPIPAVYATWKVYLDGMLVSKKLGMFPLDADYTLNYIGKSMWSSNPVLDGYLDSFNIYSSTLSDANVIDLVVVSVQHHLYV